MSYINEKKKIRNEVRVMKEKKGKIEEKRENQVGQRKILPERIKLMNDEVLIDVFGQIYFIL